MSVKTALQTVDVTAHAIAAVLAAAVCSVLMLGFFPGVAIDGTRSGEAAFPPSAFLEHIDTCWTASDKPMAPWPGAAVVRDLRTGEVFYTARHKVVDAAIDNVFGKKSVRYETVALCK